MPVDRTTAYGPSLELDIADRLLEIYTSTERQLAADIARRLRAGMDAPDWAQRKLAQAGALRRSTLALLGKLGTDDGRIAQALTLAYMRGGDAANAELLRLGTRPPGTGQDAALRAVLDARGPDVARRLADATRAFPGLGNLQRMVFSLASRLSGTHLPVLRWALDSYREAVAEGALAPVLLGTATRRAATQRAWERLLADGVKGFTDKAGRRWNLASYVEMATRTGVAQAAVEGHLDRLTAAGIDLVIVSNAPQECERCRPWEGKVLARSGPDGRRTVQVQSAVSDDQVTVEIRGTVDEAVRAGLLHPNCRHSLSGFLPGATRIPTNTADPEGDEARQQLRALERDVRKLKLQQAGSIDPKVAATYDADIRAKQAEIRAHVAATEHLGIMRKPEREQIDLGHTTGEGLGRPARAPKPAPKPKPAAVVPKAAQPYHGSVAGLEDLAADVKQVRADTPRTKLSGGVSAATDFVQLPDGRRLVHKTGLEWSPDPAEVAASVKHQADAEQLASLLGRAIDAPVARVYRTERDSVWMEYIDSADGNLSDLLDTPEGIRLGLLDVLAANADRNVGNMLIRDGRLVGIDHGWAWGEGGVDRLVQGVYSWPDRPIKHFLEVLDQYGPNPLHPADVDVLVSRLTALQPDFDRLGRGNWLRYSLAILEQMRPFATGTERLYG